jgi:hypothetical protein
MCGMLQVEITIHTFVFDEHYTSLVGTGSAINLINWYDPGTIITHMVIPSGPLEEVVLIDNATRARIFYLITQQFR